ncbi:MAG: transcriptional repressor [Ruminococcaceae bacterium]|nr:transcriptional repressor [Oscillospiraceae bacterium]
MKKAYRTAGKETLLHFFEENHDRQFTAEEIYLAVSKDVSVGRSSVYRNLSLLCESDTVKKFHSDERGGCVYQYVGESCDCREHFHEKCTRCGRVMHLDCHATAEFVSHLLSEHGFSVDCGQSILYGICADCRGKGGACNA